MATTESPFDVVLQTQLRSPSVFIMLGQYRLFCARLSTSTRVRSSSCGAAWATGRNILFRACFRRFHTVRIEARSGAS